MDFNPATFASGYGNQTVSGELAMSLGDVANLRKALEAGYGSDVATLTGGGALRIQSLESTMLSTIQSNQHFKLMNMLAKSPATATVDEWTEQAGVGGFWGGSTNTETGTINAAQGDYARRVGQVKYLMTRREVSFVATLQNSIVEAEAVEQTNGALQLLTDAEVLNFEGDSTVVPTEWDGIYAQVSSLGSVNHIIDLAGQPLDSFGPISNAAATIAGSGNYGTPTHLLMSQLVQSDLDTKLEPQYRVTLSDAAGGGVQLGSPVVGVRTSSGEIKTEQDVFIRDERQQMVFELAYSAIASANAGQKPTFTAVADGSGGADSAWGAAHAGNYYYLITGINAKGESTGDVSSQVTVAASGKVTLTITASSSNAETGYVIYRGRKNGTNAKADLRRMVRIPKDVSGTTVYLDKNREIPGSTRAFMLNMNPGQLAITWRQFLPMTRFNLYPTVNAVIPWAQMLMGYLRIGKRRHHVVFKNIVPNGALWKPFG